MDKLEKFIQEYKLGKFQSDSDIEEYCEEQKIDIKNAFCAIDRCNTIGTPCEGCKHVAFRFSMYPCTLCTRCKKDMCQ